MQKSKSLQNLENRMQDLDPNSFRYKALECARSFKSSWIDLGQYLFTIHKEKLYKDWGYLTFDAYTAKEIGIRQPTALKLLKSYAFLEKEEPAFLKREAIEERRPTQIPSVDAVHSLRLAKQNENLPLREYEDLREEVFENNKEDQEIKAKIKYVLKKYTNPSDRQNEEDPKTHLLKKILMQLESAKSQCIEFKFPAKILNQIDELMELLKDYKG